MPRKFSNRTCSMPDCDRKHYGRGYCGTHLARVVRHGDPNATRPTPEVRFWNRVDKTPGQGPNGDCWEWMGHRDRDGYGSFRGRDARKGAHVVACELAHGPLGPGEQALHHCDNPPCCRGEHLFKGSPLDNMTDKIAKGRLRVLFGEEHPNSFLTEDIIREIRQRYIPRVITLAFLAEEYGTTMSNISAIIRRKRWAHIHS